MQDEKFKETNEKLTQIGLFGHLGFCDGTQSAPLGFAYTY